MESIYKISFWLRAVAYFVDGSDSLVSEASARDVVWCFESSSLFWRVLFLFIGAFLFVFFAGEGKAPSSDPTPISIDFRHFTAVFSLSVNHVSEL